jgi:hypothetical protein
MVVSRYQWCVSIGIPRLTPNSISFFSMLTTAVAHQAFLFLRLVNTETMAAKLPLFNSS